MTPADPQRLTLREAAAAHPGVTVGALRQAIRRGHLTAEKLETVHGPTLTLDAEALAVYVEGRKRTSTPSVHPGGSKQVHPDASALVQAVEALTATLDQERAERAAQLQALTDQVKSLESELAARTGQLGHQLGQLQKALPTRSVWTRAVEGLRSRFRK